MAWIGRQKPHNFLNDNDVSLYGYLYLSNPEVAYWWVGDIIETANMMRLAGFTVKDDKYRYARNWSGTALTDIPVPYQGKFTFSPPQLLNIEFTFIPMLPVVENWIGVVSDYVFSSEQVANIVAHPYWANYYLAQQHLMHHAILTYYLDGTRLWQRPTVFPQQVTINGNAITSVHQNSATELPHFWGINTAYTSLINSSSTINRSADTYESMFGANGETGECYFAVFNTVHNVIESLVYFAPIINDENYSGAYPFRYAMLTIAIDNNGTDDVPIMTLEGINEDGTTTLMNFISNDMIDIPATLIEKSIDHPSNIAENFCNIYPIYKESSVSTKPPFILGRFGNIKFSMPSSTNYSANPLWMALGAGVLPSKYLNFPDIQLPTFTENFNGTLWGTAISGVDETYTDVSAFDLPTGGVATPAESYYWDSSDTPEINFDLTPNPQHIDYAKLFTDFYALAVAAATSLYQEGFGTDQGDLIFVTADPEYQKRMVIDYFVQRILSHFNVWASNTSRPVDMASIKAYAS